jgi:virulence-associated protein VapD
MATQKRYKALNFDLDTKKLREVFGEKGRRKAYFQIQSFLAKNGFEHRQWSGYASLKPMSYIEIYDIVGELVDEHEWLIDCVNRFDATNIMSETDMLHAIRNHKADKQTVPGESGIIDEMDDINLKL